MSIPCKHSILSMACALGLATTGLAHAQDPAQPGPSDADRPIELERVTASAQKRTESITEVPMGISVLGEQRLEQLGAGRLTDYAAYVPGFQVDSGGAPGVTSMSLRGIAPLGGGAIIGTYIDDSPVNPSGNKQRATSYALDMLPYDVESIEVLRGPQGTLYGGSAMGGLFKYITRAADTENHEFRAGMELNTISGGSKLGTGVRASANIPLEEGKLGMRASFSRQTTPGYVNEVNLGRNDTNSYSQEAARLAFTLNITDDVQLRVQGLWQEVDADSIAQVGIDPVTLEPEAGPLDGNAYLLQPYRNKVEFYSAILDWDLGFADFLSSTSFSETRMNITTDSSPVYGVAWPLFGFDPGLANFDMYLGNRKWSQEFRLTSNSDDRFEWLVGGFYTEETNTNRQLVQAWDNDFNELPFSPAALIALPGSYKEGALFGDVTWKFSPSFDLSAGLRVARNEQWFAQITEGPLVGDANTPGTSEETVKTWKLAARWHLGEDSLLYARVATGYRPGGPNLALPGVPAMVNSDTSRNYELGFKSQLWNRRAMIDAAVFRIDWDGLQVGAVTGAGLNYITNAGDARSQGAELAFLLRATERLSWAVNAAYIDSNIGNDVPDTSGLVPGGVMPLTPKRSWSTTLDYDFDVGDAWRGKVGGGYRYTGDRIGLSGFEMDAYSAVDLHAELSNMAWTWRLFVRNAGNEQAFMSMSALRNALTGETSQIRGTPLVPRTIGLSVDYRF